MNLEIIILVMSPILFGGITWYFLKSRNELHEKERLEMARVMMHNQKIAQEEVKIKNMLEESRLRGQTIIKLSEKLAQELILELETALGIKRDKFTTIIPQGDSFEAKLQSMSGALKSEYVKRILEIVNNLGNYEQSKAHVIDEFGENQLVKNAESMQKIRSDELVSLQSKLNRYKQEEMALFNRKVEAVVNEAAKEVLGTVLSLEEHERMVIKALEKAKANNAL